MNKSKIQGQVNFSNLYLSLCTNSHDEMKTQWEHPKTGKKKRCAGGLLHLLIFQCFTVFYFCLFEGHSECLCVLSNVITSALQPSDLPF